MSEAGEEPLLKRMRRVEEDREHTLAKRKFQDCVYKINRLKKTMYRLSETWGFESSTCDECGVMFPTDRAVNFIDGLNVCKGCRVFCYIKERSRARSCHDHKCNCASNTK